MEHESSPHHPEVHVPGRDAAVFHGDLSNFDTSRVADMQNMYVEGLYRVRGRQLEVDGDW